jgi:hypothetical protein
MFNKETPAEIGIGYMPEKVVCEFAALAWLRFPYGKSKW